MGLVRIQGEEDADGFWYHWWVTTHEIGVGFCITGRRRCDSVVGGDVEIGGGRAGDVRASGGGRGADVVVVLTLCNSVCSTGWPGSSSTKDR
ncbi:unnamed protein product [Linum trigynum]|uniref:Uncharacterized protein n=1 Tax=Linum trigynum TaxID=586398 RepID=A0AAV2GQW0_9ROSI